MCRCVAVSLCPRVAVSTCRCVDVSLCSRVAVSTCRCVYAPLCACTAVLTFTDMCGMHPSSGGKLQNQCHAPSNVEFNKNHFCGDCGLKSNIFFTSSLRISR
ncbi:hypothetical protein BaRGS_00028252 [Batillaria attramentaria]|uniref:Secreted protein n=1 Tax=Batillaria attramentaria TaxID=370345 RepID=A0ABD0K0P8_9CAEN